MNAPATPSSAHHTLSEAAAPELRASAAGHGRLSLQLTLGHDVFTVQGVSVGAAGQMFSAQLRGGALWHATRSLRAAPLSPEVAGEALVLRPDHSGFKPGFTLSAHGEAARDLPLSALPTALQALAGGQRLGGSDARPGRSRVRPVRRSQATSPARPGARP